MDMSCPLGSVVLDCTAGQVENVGQLLLRALTGHTRSPYRILHRYAGVSFCKRLSCRKANRTRRTRNHIGGLRETCISIPKGCPVACSSMWLPVVVKLATLVLGGGEHCFILPLKRGGLVSRFWHEEIQHVCPQRRFRLRRRRWPCPGSYQQTMAVKALSATPAGASLNGSDDSTINGPTYPDATAGRLLELFLG